jgi:hypothetical protein
METSENKILNNYYNLLSGLSIRLKLELIEKLTQSIKAGLSSEYSIKSAFGAWQSEQSAEELIKQIESSRQTNRHLEEI